jgi:serine/threonine protein kinase
MASDDEQEVKPEGSDDAPLAPSNLSSGLLAQQSSPSGQTETVAVAKVCPQCDSEYLTTDRFCPRDGSPLRPKAGDDPLIGRVIAERYLILARLGEGGMGRVYLGEHMKMNRQCAIKVMNPNLVNDTDSATRFSREASNAARILHPNVAAVFDYGEADKIVYLVMEFVDGEPLSTILEREGALEPRRAVDIARQIADGLAAAHELGIVHRDLKPDNVIVTRSRNQREIPKVVDFGIAKAVTGLDQKGLTRSGLVIGTPEYMAPEQLLGDPVDAHADVYSLGCILYQMLTGIQAFAGDTREQMIRRRLHEKPPHAREVVPGIPRQLDALITKMLARSATERLANGAEVRDALDPAKVLAGYDETPKTGPRARPNLAATRVGPVAESANLQATVQMPSADKPKGRSPLLGIMYAIVIAALGTLTYLQRDKLGFGRVATLDTTTASKDTVRKDSIASVAPKTPLPNLDSISKATAAKRTADSLALETAKADSLLHAPLKHYADAFNSSDVNAVIQAYPGTMPDKLRETLTNFMAGAQKFQSKAIFGDATITGDRAELPFTVQLRYTPKGTFQTQTSPLKYRAVLVKENGVWKISQLTPAP